MIQKAELNKFCTILLSILSKKERRGEGDRNREKDRERGGEKERLKEREIEGGERYREIVRKRKKER